MLPNVLRYMKQTPLERKINEIIDPVVKDLGFEVVQVRLIGSAKMQTLQILAEDPATGKIDLNGCTAVSRAVSAILDVEDPIPAAYQLEVSSPGVDRPLTRESDFEKYKGLDIAIETSIPNDNGQKRFKGKLTNFADNVIYMGSESGDVKIDFDDVLKAKLVLTEELVTGKAKGQKKTLNPKKTDKAKQPVVEEKDDFAEDFAHEFEEDLESEEL